MPQIDFGYGNIESNDPTTPDVEEPKTDIETGKEDAGDDTSKIDDTSSQEDDANKGKEGKTEEEDDKKDDKKDDKDDDLSSKLVEGAKIEIGNSTYTVDSKGNLVDDAGAIFKNADEVVDYLKTLDQTDEGGESTLDVSKIADAIGIDIVDDNNNPVEFENSPEGIKQYVNAVIQTTQQEIAETAINTLYSRYPILKDTAWAEQNRKGSVDNYIQYLKSSGTLKTVAKEELEGLKEADAKYRQELADKARAEEEAELQRQAEYWTGVKKVIDGKQIAGYKIPDTIMIERDGKKLATTPNDFFNYIYKVDKEGYSQYQRDLMKESAESRRDDEILRAYLKFVGGNYSNLVDMAINEQKVNTLKFKAKENNSRKTTFKVTPPSKNNDKKETDFGY